MKPLALFGAGVFLVLLLIETVFRLLPVSTATRTGYFLDPLILTYPAKHCFTVSTGWDLRNPQHHCANNLGFIADRDFSDSPQAIALIGDSFVEANMLSKESRLAAQLESRLSGRPVFALGGPGSSLLDYAERAKFAARRFGIRTFVFVLERGDVRQAVCGSGNIHGRCVDNKSLEIQAQPQPGPSLAKRLVRESALAQYIFSQLKFNPAEFARIIPQAAPSARAEALPSSPAADISAIVVREFFANISQIGDIQIYIVVDPDRANLAREVSLPVDLQLLRDAARQYGAIEIDPTPKFRDFVARTGLALEVGPYDRHWNSEAVRLVSTAVADAVATVK